MSAQAPVLFIGMVTHARSRFNAAGEARRLALDLAQAATAQGLTAEAVVNETDEFDPRTYPLSRRELVRSALYQSRLEYRWRRYLDMPGSRAHDMALLAAMSVRRVVQALTPNPFAPVLESRGGRAAIRLLNIDLAHLSLMEQAVQSGAQWALILEDDAGVADPGEAMRDVAGLIAVLSSWDTSFVNVSESISWSDLGVEGILTPAGVTLGGGSDLALWQACRPVTNTVCANLYRTDFLRDLHAEVTRKGLLPVAPIDWRVNEALMTLHASDRTGATTCMWTSPGLFEQRSMQDTPA